MAKQCIYCGQPLLKDDARFCTDCGHAQIPSSGVGVESSSIKVKLPPKEFLRGEVSSAWQEKDISARPDGELSTMVTSGWEEELALLRKELSSVNGPLPEEPTNPSPRKAVVWPSPSATLVSEMNPSPRKAVVWPSPSAPPLPEQRQDETPSTAEPTSVSAESIVPAADLARRELHVKVWEQEETVQYPQSHAGEEKPGLTSPVDQSPLPQLAFDTDESVAEIADLDTLLWKAVDKPIILKEGDERVSGALKDRSVRIEERDDALEGDAKEENIEDLPTALLAVPPEVAKPRSEVAFEQDSTPVSKNRSAGQVELNNVADLPTKPIVLDPASIPPRAPVSPIPPAAPQPAVRTREQPTKLDRPASSPQVSRANGNPISVSRGATPSSGQLPFGQSANSAQGPSAPFDVQTPRGRVANTMSQPGNMNSFNSPASPSGQQPNPYSLPGNTLFRPNGPGTQPRPLSQTPPMPGQGSASPRSQPLSAPDVAPTPATVEEPRKKRGTGQRVLVTLLIVLLIVSGGGYLIYLHPLTNPLPPAYQAYQNTSLGFSLSYPQGWKANVDQIHSVVHFTDDTQTGQVSLAISAASSQTLDQYLMTEATQLGITGSQVSSSASFAGAVWEQAQGTLMQSGATYKVALYVTQHKDRLYALAFLAPLSPSSVYTQMEHDDFGPLRASFMFL